MRKGCMALVEPDLEMDNVRELGVDVLCSPEESKSIDAPAGCCCCGALLVTPENRDRSVNRNRRIFTPPLSENNMIYHLFSVIAETSTFMQKRSRDFFKNHHDSIELDFH